MKDFRTTMTKSRVKVAGFALIVALAMTAGMFASWRLPGLKLLAQDQLMRTRGDLAEPDDILIVAIDEASIAKLGQFPWKRSLTAQVLDRVSASGAKAVALDVLYGEPTDAAEDKALSESLNRSGNVVIGEQLVENRDTPELAHSEWLRPLPELEKSAAGVGHVNVGTERDGVARELLLRLADDEGNPSWAMAIETVRVGDSLGADQVSDTLRFVRIGTRKIPFAPTESNLFIKNDDSSGGISIIKPLRMNIDYIGATGSFASQTVSFTDVLDGKIAGERFRGKYVLIGATAATLGDRIATPFVHIENVEGDQHGDLMPGVEILANEVNTILRGRFYENISDWTTAGLAALIAVLVLFLTGIAEGRFEAAKQIGVLGALFVLIVLGSYFAFTRAFVVLPVVPLLASFAVATPLAILRRSLAASTNLDERIAELVHAGNRLLSTNKTGLSPSVNENQELGSGTNASFVTKGILPRGLEWKTETIGHLSRDLIERSLFVDRALRSLDEGLIIADSSGMMTFVNERAAEIVGFAERKLIGSDLFSKLSQALHGGEITESWKDESLGDLMNEQKTIEREIVIGRTTPRYYLLRLSAVVSEEAEPGKTLGYVASLSDVSQHRELEKTKNDVLALVTHELRTPLTAIQGMSELLTEHKIEPEAQRKMLSTINVESKRLARMVNDYLDITRLESGTETVRFTPTDAEAVIDRTLLLLEPLASKREIEFVRHFGSESRNIEADAELLGRAITNIIANAIKYSPDKTTITIETSSDSEALNITIRDEGDGIPADQLPRIFEKFYRAPQRRSRENPGTGLGLSLTQEIIEMHGGYITVESELGKGSIFTVSVPFVR
jgi:PAS domain S-box-containing protein